MTVQQQFYDRVEIYANGIQYLPNGQIRSFNLAATYNTKSIQGFSQTGLSTGFVIGNIAINDISWVEYLPQASDYVNWRIFCDSNPNAVFTIVPVSLSTGAPNAPVFALSGVNPTTITIGAPSEGEVMTRDCKFIAISSSNL